MRAGRSRASKGTTGYRDHELELSDVETPGG